MRTSTAIRQTIISDRESAGVRQFDDSRMRQRRRLRFWFLLTPCLLVVSGCKDVGQPSSMNGQADNFRPNINQLNLSTGASPSEIAREALIAIKAKDKTAMERLIAVKKVKQDVEAITGGRSSFRGMLDSAIPTAVGAISSEINWLDVEGREIDQETITGTTAIVTVKGKRAGEEQTRRFFLVQEDAQWRLVPSHR